MRTDTNSMKALWFHAALFTICLISSTSVFREAPATREEETNRTREKKLKIPRSNLTTRSCILCNVSLPRDNDMVMARELVFGSSEGFKCMLLVRIFATHAHDRITDVDTSHQAVGFPECVGHTSLKTKRKKKDETKREEKMGKRKKTRQTDQLRHN